MQESEYESMEEKFKEKQGWKVLTYPIKLTNAVLESLPLKRLADDEQQDRLIWSAQRKEWRVKTSRFHIQTGTLLKSRVLAPFLNAESVNISERSDSSSRRRRTFPPKDCIEVWSEFDEKVRDFEPEGSFWKEDDDILDPWFTSGNYQASCGDEKAEQLFVQGFVLQPLCQAGLLHYIDSDTGLHGLCNLVLREPNATKESAIESIYVSVKFKATHNLWLPEAARDIVRAYGKADEDSKLKECVFHPIGQLVRSMIINQTVFGVLSSAARTYFVRLVPKNVGTVTQVYLKISRRWYIAEKNYLSAWAWFYQVASKVKWDDSYSAVRKWSQTTPNKPYLRSSARLGSGHNAGAGGVVNTNLVLWDNIQLTGVILGGGQHGLVYEALYKDELVAVKYFNAEERKSRNQFEREFNAYKLLRPVQGKLVPRLICQNEHWTGAVLMLVLQRGRAVDPETDVNAESDKDHVLHELRELGFEHGDCDGFRNFIYITDGSGEERMAAIDLEYLEPTMQDSPTTSKGASSSVRCSNSDSSSP